MRNFPTLRSFTRVSEDSYMKSAIATSLPDFCTHIDSQCKGTTFPLRSTNARRPFSPQFYWQLGTKHQTVETALVDEDNSLISTGGDHFVHPFIFAINMVANSFQGICITKCLSNVTSYKESLTFLVNHCSNLAEHLHKRGHLVMVICHFRFRERGYLLTIINIFIIVAVLTVSVFDFDK